MELKELCYHSMSKLAFYLFADDTNIYCEGENLNLFQKTGNKELKKVKIWLDANKLASLTLLFLSLLGILLLILLVSKSESSSLAD